MSGQELAVVVLQCRVGSSRLPAKALLPLGGMPMAILAAKRAGNTGRKVILATTDDQSDDALVEEARAHGIEFFRGDRDDVLARFVDALRGLPDRTLVIRLTGDNPVPDGLLIDEVIEEFLDRKLDYITTTHPESGLPYGVSVEVTRAEYLRAAAAEVCEPFMREHVTRAVMDRFGSIPFIGRAAVARAAWRMTVDNLDDYLSMRRIINNCADPLAARWSDLVMEAERGLYQPGNPLPATQIVLGTAQLGMDYGLSGHKVPSQSECEALIKTAIGNGCVWLDTARAYGSSEESIGNALATGWSARCRVVTKLDTLEQLSEEDSEAHWRSAVELSVLRSSVYLRSKRIDTLLLHRASHLSVRNGVVWRHLRDLRDAGLIGRLGVSVQNPEELAMVLDVPDVKHIQIPASIVDGRWEQLKPRIEEKRQNNGMTVHLRSIFLQGLLLSSNPQDWERAYSEKFPLVREWLERMAVELSRKNVADLCLGWAMAQTWVDGIVIGVDDLSQLEANLALSRQPPLKENELNRLARERPVLSSMTLDPANWKPSP